MNALELRDLHGKYHTLGMLFKGIHNVLDEMYLGVQLPNKNFAFGATNSKQYTLKEEDGQIIVFSNNFNAVILFLFKQIKFMIIRDNQSIQYYVRDEGIYTQH